MMIPTKFYASYVVTQLEKISPFNAVSFAARLSSFEPFYSKNGLIYLVVLLSVWFRNKKFRYAYEMKNLSHSMQNLESP